MKRRERYDKNTKIKLQKKKQMMLTKRESKRIKEDKKMQTVSAITFQKIVNAPKENKKYTTN